MIIKRLAGLVIFMCAVTGGKPATAEPSAEPQQTAAAILGFDPAEKLLIIHADDVGMCHAGNRATIDGMTNGFISSGSIMMPCPWIPGIIEYARKNPDKDFGLHLTLNSEWKHFRWRPVAPVEKVPSLVDENGYLWHGTGQTATRATAEEVEIELRAQVQRALDLGLKPTHLDTHMGTVYARPDFFGAYRKVALEFGLPYLLPRVTPEEMERLPKSLQIMAKTMLTPLLATGEVTLDHLERGFPGGRPISEQKEYYMDVIRNLKPGISQIIIHPAYDDDGELEAITGTHERRDGEAHVFQDPAIGKLLKQENIRLLTWREIGEKQALLRARKKARQ